MKKGLLITFLVLVIVSGCSVLPGLSPSGESIEITDTTGHVVTLNGVPERIAIAGRATIMVQDAVFLFDDAIQKVIALENRKQSAFSFLPVVDQGIYEKEIFEMNAGPEQIAVAQSDLVILKNFMAEKLGEPLEQLSIPVIYLNLETPEVFYQDIVVLGQVFGKPDRADEIINFYQDRVTRVEELVSVVEPDQIPEVLILEYSDNGGEIAFSVPPVSWLQTSMVEISAGSPVWKSLEVSGGWTIVNLERDLTHARSVAREEGLDAQALSNLAQMVQQNPGDGGAKAVNTFLGYALAYGVRTDQLKDIVGELTQRPASVLPQIPRKADVAVIMTKKKVIQDVLTGLGIGLVVIWALL